MPKPIVSSLLKTLAAIALLTSGALASPPQHLDQTPAVPAPGFGSAAVNHQSTLLAEVDVVPPLDLSANTFAAEPARPAQAATGGYESTTFAPLGESTLSLPDSASVDLSPTNSVIETGNAVPAPNVFPSTGASSFAVEPAVDSTPAPVSEPILMVQPQTPGPPQPQPQIWQAPATPTPGHNERERMRPDLSLSQPPQPGSAVQEYLPVQPPAFSTQPYLPNFDPQVGHRRRQPVKRAEIYPLDDGEKFSFETKKRDFPPFAEIIATGRFFYMAEVLWAEPQFQGNTAIATEGLNFGESISNDFDSDFHPRIRAGFESPYGPGMELSYFHINSNSEIASFTSNGVISGQTNAWVIGRNVWSRIVADDPGEILTSQHSIDIDSGTISFFKELKFPISRVNGNFGFQYVSIAQQLNASVVSANGTTVETLQSVSDMRAFGPRAIIEYYRPIGHTPLELVTTFGGAVLFGQRDQFVTNSQTGLENRLGADEFLTIIDFLVALQYTRTVGENRSWYGRFGFMNQTWIGGGSAVFPQGDFGLRGLTFGIGYNR